MVDPLAVLNAVVAGVMLGGFYAAVALGIAIAFGMLDVPNLSHPAFVVAGAFATWQLNSRLGLDPVVAGVLLTPVFYGLGVVVYRLYHVCFERRGETALQGLAFFFGLLFITEVALVMIAGADYRSVVAPYIGSSREILGVTVPNRMLVPFVVSIVMIATLHQFLLRTFTGRAIQAVAQDQTALRLMGIGPTRIKAFAFGVATATASIAGALLIIIEPVEPSVGRDFIGRAFAAVVLGGMGSFWGMLFASIILGITESLVSDMWNPSWAPAIAFGFLLPTLAFRSSGLLGRRL
ncbi:MAG TPA: branched-chain amino acid ABC transporter permease [Reyranella sp.]|jgi:branched-chain amino acid transport system permease protein|nr:branched-chain amino acid ABC transporter permease [Reyranella sp.]